MAPNDTTGTVTPTDAPTTAPSAPTALQPRQPDRVPVRMGVAPQNFDDAFRMSRAFAETDLVPKHYRGKPADVLAAIQYGMEVGLPPMAALQSIFVTNGRPSLWGDGLLAVVVASPAYKDHDEYYTVVRNGVVERVDVLTIDDLKIDTTTAVVTFWRRDVPRPRTASFSIAHARKAGLLAKEGPWQTYPDRMLKMRARAFAARDAFPDVLRGLRTVEELRDMPPVDEPPPPPVVRRISESGPDALTAQKAPSAPPPQRDELPAATIVRVDAVGDGQYDVVLDGGEVIACDDASAARLLATMIDAAHKVRLTVVRDGDRLRLDDYAIAD